MMIIPVKIPHYLASIPCIVDDEDFERLKGYKFRKSHKYVGRSFGRGIFYIHREIMDCPKGMEVDHRDGNSLDNRKQNLRICTHAENLRNNRKKKNNISGYKGVYLVKRRNLWVAKIQYDGKEIWGGYFKIKEEAAKRYEELSKQYHGEFGRIK